MTAFKLIIPVTNDLFTWRKVGIAFCNWKLSSNNKSLLGLNVLGLNVFNLVNAFPLTVITDWCNGLPQRNWSFILNGACFRKYLCIKLVFWTTQSVTGLARPKLLNHKNNYWTHPKLKSSTKYKAIKREVWQAYYIYICVKDREFISIYYRKP